MAKKIDILIDERMVDTLNHAWRTLRRDGCYNHAARIATLIDSIEDVEEEVDGRQNSVRP